MNRIVVLATASAAAACAAPIPIADAVALTGIPLSMLSRVAKIYDITLTDNALSVTIPQLLTSLGGKALAAQLTKLIPSWGLAINATAGGALTAALGAAWAKLCEMDGLGGESILKLVETSQLSEVLNDLMAKPLRQQFQNATR